MMDTGKLLEGKVIILVGAGGALGKVFADRLSEAGGSVVMLGRHIDRLQDECRVLADRGRSVCAMQADFKSLEDAKRVFRDTIGKYGKVDALITNASRTGKNVSLEAEEDEDIEEIIDTDVKGLLWWNREALRHFLARDAGVILNIGSNNVGRPICDAAYCAAKYAEWGLTRQIAMRCVATGVRCNMLNPGSFPSDSAANINNGNNSSHLYDAGEKVQASGRIPVVNGSMIDIMKARTNRGVPVNLDQVAYAAVYLISDYSKDVNGQVFTVDRGGYM